MVKPINPDVAYEGAICTCDDLIQEINDEILRQKTAGSIRQNEPIIVFTTRVYDEKDAKEACRRFVEEGMWSDAAFKHESECGRPTMWQFTLVY